MGRTRFLGIQKLHSKQTKMVSSYSSRFSAHLRVYGFVIGIVSGAMWLMDYSAGLQIMLVVLNRALAPPDRLRSCDASDLISSVMLIETSSHSKLSGGLSPQHRAPYRASDLVLLALFGRSSFARRCPLLGVKLTTSTRGEYFRV